MLLEERFHVQPEQRRGGYDPIEDKPVTIAREDAEDKYSLPVAQRVHALPQRYQWQAMSMYLHEPENFVPLAQAVHTGWIELH
ncbi:hypothetical protein GQ56_0128415 [Burkholderia paludis]|nr:hypothetical protein GQ56_0128415 [Burkholderia paludis]